MPTCHAVIKRACYTPAVVLRRSLQSPRKPINTPADVGFPFVHSGMAAQSERVAGLSRGLKHDLECIHEEHETH